MTFAAGAPLPDDRFTLTVNDSIKDPAGNELDGESNAAEPNGGPTFPSGDSTSGGDFVARFTVDSRPEVATWSQGAVYADINGNFVWDPEGQDNDAVNRDFTYKFGLSSDAYFTGNFAPPAGALPSVPATAGTGFDKLGVYGAVAGRYGFAIDTTDNGVADTFPTIVPQVNGIPVAGNFFNSPADIAAVAAGGRASDEIGLFDGRNWYFDINGDYNITAAETFPTTMRGIPLVGDFDGNGFDDLATYNNNTGAFQFIMLNATPTAATVNGAITQTVVLFPGTAGRAPATAPPVTPGTAEQGFAGFGEIPLAGDINLDGIDDIALWVPKQEGQLPKEAGEFFILVSDGPPAVAPAIANPSPVTFLSYSPAPLGNDLSLQFGDDFALPLFGNFDPPIEITNEPLPVGSLTNELNPLDTNVDGVVTARDALVVINAIGRGDIDPSASPMRVVAALGGLHLDASQDGRISSLDALRVINGLAQLNLAAESEAPAVEETWAVAADGVLAELGDDDEDDLLQLLAVDAELARVKS